MIILRSLLLEIYYIIKTEWRIKFFLEPNCVSAKSELNMGIDNQKQRRNNYISS